VVEAEQVGELVGVGPVPLQVVDELELAVDQSLVAPAEVDDISAIERRRAACSTATRTATRCTLSNAPATSPISSREATGSGGVSVSSSSTRVAPCSRSTTLGSRSSAT
jgi:hypothetical protein